MLHGVDLSQEFFARLVKLDEELVRRVAADACPKCEGPLHRSDYSRKPRGGLFALAGEALNKRFSLCCGWCRRRCLPPSVRFLGRRVYLEVVVLLACVWALGSREVPTGVPARTLQRWLGWWSSIFPVMPTWIELRARFAPPPPPESLLPLSFVGRLAAELGPLDVEKILVMSAQLIAPVTTQSCPNASRFVRVN